MCVASTSAVNQERKGRRIGNIFKKKSCIKMSFLLIIMQDMGIGKIKICVLD